MNQDAVNQLNADYVNIGSWLHSLSNLPNDLSLAYLMTLKGAVSQMQQHLEVVEAEVRNQQT
ncbi:MAG: hypothetical protein ACXWTS_02525 [Methylococcaceae bacterium]